MSEIKPESCMDCPKYIYKGDDEQYCRAARMRMFSLARWQKKPRWCPFERRERYAMPRVQKEG